MKTFLKSKKVFSVDVFMKVPQTKLEAQKSTETF